jgi:hypothetical protein
MRPTYRRRRQVLFPLRGSGPDAGGGKPNAGRTRSARFASSIAGSRTRAAHFTATAPSGRTRAADCASAARGSRARGADHNQRAAAHV